VNTFDLVERHHGVRLICHAIRHLLDHTPDEANSGDTKAIDILQSAINPAEDSHRLSCAAEGQYAESCASRIPIATKAQVQPGESYEPDRTNVSEIVRDSPPAEPARRKHPVSLLSLLELLLRAVHHKALGHRASPATHDSPLESVR
jgi:hypothetical protein